MFLRRLMEFAIMALLLSCTEKAVGPGQRHYKRPSQEIQQEKANSAVPSDVPAPQGRQTVGLNLKLSPMP